MSEIASTPSTAISTSPSWAHAEYATSPFTATWHIRRHPKTIVAIFRKFRKALKPGGTRLSSSDFILADDRTGHPFAMMFTAQMLVVTQGGSAYRQCDYRAWLAEAGFKSVEIPWQRPRRRTLVFATS